MNHQEQTASKDAERKLIFQADMQPVKGGFLAKCVQAFLLQRADCRLHALLEHRTGQRFG